MAGLILSWNGLYGTLPMAWRMHDKFRTEMETDQAGLASTGTNFKLYLGQGGHGGALVVVALAIATALRRLRRYWWWRRWRF